MNPAVAAVAGSSGVPMISSPEELGTVLTWYRSDQADIATTPGFVESVPDDGTGGGAFGYNGTRPKATKQFGDLKTAARFSDGVGASLQSSLAASNFNYFHSDSGSCTLTIRYYSLGVPDSDRALLATQNSGSEVGVALHIRGDGSSRILVSAGAGNNAVATTSTDCAGKGWHTMQITKAANTYAFTVDGVDNGSGALGTTSGADATHAMAIGSHSSQVLSYNGFVAEVVVHDFALNASQLSLMRDYVEGRWNSVPGIVAYHDSDDLADDGDGYTTFWDDRAVGNNLFQPTSENRPEYVDEWRNGHSALRGGDGLEMVSSFLGGPAYPVMIWSVIETPDTWSTTGARMVARSADGQLASYFANSNHRATTHGGTAVVQIADQPTGTPMILKSWNDGTEGGIGVIPHGGSAEEATASIGTYHLDGLTVLGQSGVTNFHGLIGSIVVVDHIPSAAGIAEIETALKDRYDIVPT